MNRTYEPFAQTSGPVAFIHFETYKWSQYVFYDIRYNTMNASKDLTPDFDYCGLQIC